MTRWKYKNHEEYLKTTYNKMCLWQKSPKGRFHVYKQNAKRRGLSFNLTFKEFDNLLKQNCYFCNDIGGGIDRINSYVGYDLKNCLPCCTLCNKMKSDNDINIFISQCNKISNNFK